MSKQIIWSPLSEKDFTSILDYLEKNREPKVALKFIEITNELLYQISYNPRQFPIIYK